MNTVDLNSLSAEQKQALKEQIKAEEAAAKKKVAEDRETYKLMVEEFVATLFPSLEALSEEIANKKKFVFDSAATLLEMKASAFGIKSDQKSHTFTDTKGRTIMIGHRIVDRYDDTVHTGIAKVREFVKTLATNDETGVLVDTVLSLLKMDKEGNLKPSRVMELQQICNKLDNPVLLKDGIDIIQNAYKAEKTCNFVDVSFKDENGRNKSLSLSMSSID